MKRKLVSGIMLTLLSIGILALAFNIQPVKSTQEPPAVEWSKTYGRATGNDANWHNTVVQTEDGGYAIASTADFGAGEVWWLVKTDSNGDVEWNKTYPTSEQGRVFSLVRTSDGGYGLAGDTYSGGLTNIARVVKTDASGIVQWDRRYTEVGVAVAYSMIQTNDGGYVTAGCKYYYDGWLMKTDADGNMQWSRSFVEVNNTQLEGVVQTSDGGFIAAGATQYPPFSGKVNAYVVRTDSDGNITWSKEYSRTSGNDYAGPIIQASDVGYVIAGATDIFGSGDAWLLKIDESGSLIWEKTYDRGNVDSESAGSIVQTNDGGYILAGRTSFSGIGDAWLIKTDSAGTASWNQTFGGAGYDRGYSVIQTSDSGYALAGFTNSFSGDGSYEVWLIKLAGHGPIILSQNFDNETTGAVPEGWTVENPEVCSLKVNETVYYGASGKSARFVDSSGGFSYVGRTFETQFSSQNGSVVVEFAMRAEVPYYLMFYIDDGVIVYDTPNGANVYFMPDGNLAYYDDSGWHYLRHFSVDTWYQIKMVIDIPTNTYDIYVDGSLEVEGAHFRGFGTVTQLSRMHFGATGFGTPIGYIDEISILGTYTHIFPGPIYIRADGSIYPSDAPIQRNGDLYTLTGNITSGSDGIVIERSNMTLDGAGYVLSGSERASGIYVDRESNVTIRNMEIKAFSDSILLQFSSSIDISRNNIVGSYSAGIEIHYSSNISITENNIATMGDGVQIDHSVDNTISRNNITRNASFGILTTESLNNTISRNSISKNTYAIGIGHSSNNNNILGNNITENTIYGIALYRSLSTSIIGNNITNNYAGIGVSSSNYNSVSGNNITNNRYWGIYASSSSNNVFSGNNMSKNDYRGIVLNDSSNNNTLSRNKMENNDIGVYLQNSFNNTLYGNIINSNNCGEYKYGVYFGDSSNNTLVRNEIGANDGYGVVFWFSSNNNFFHNAFINTRQVYSVGSNNLWDDGYPSGGNYWSDYPGIDANGDGIGDTPYIINSNNRDRYPLMNPWTLDITSPSITILSPQNTTYTTPSVPLTFTTNESTSWTGYSLDNQANVTISGNTTLTSLSEGSHSIIVYANDTSGNMGASSRVFFMVQLPPPKYTLIIGSVPTGVVFTVDGVSHTAPWSGTYDKNTLVSLEMPEMHSIGEARYYWSQWSDGVTSRSRTVTMNTNITLTAHYTGPYYELTIASSPITGITFTINGVPKTTPYTEWLPEGSYTLQMPATHDGYKWSHWLEDGDTNRIKTITLSGTTWTGVFAPAPLPPPKPVGGYSISIERPTTANPLTLYLVATTIFATVFTLAKRKRRLNLKEN